MIGEMLQHLRACFRLALLKLLGNLDTLGLLAGHVMVGAFQREIDEAGDLLAVADRNLAGDQRRDADRLKRREQVADAAVRLVDAVDENEVRYAKLVEHAQRRSRERSSCGIRVDDDDGKVGRRDGTRAVGGEADRTGAIDQREFVVEIFEIVEVELGRAATLARFGAAVADAASVGRGAQSIGCACREKHRFGEAGLARAGRSDQRDGSSAGCRGSIGMWHATLLSSVAGRPSRLKALDALFRNDQRRTVL